MKTKSINVLVAHTNGRVEQTSIDGTSNSDDTHNYMTDEIEEAIENADESGEDIISITFILVPG